MFTGPIDDGNFLGTTQYGGGRCTQYNECGTIFEIAPDGTETILYNFHDWQRGANPVGALVADGKGHFYGTAYDGGVSSYGTVFKITP
ncbi:MAG: choice-of-anchor tandem repeat GloVer-containing protein [Rhizomicrobium sp.]